jgi:hypothetical protein
MTLWTPTDTPAAINTLEKLMVWGNTVLNDLYPNTTVVEATGTANRVVQSAPFFITASDPTVWRVISRTSIALDPTWRRQGKLWLAAQDIGSSGIPAEFKA